MKARLMIVCGGIFAAGFVAASATLATPILGPKGRFSTLIYRLEYDSSHACSKPMRPFSNDAFAWQLYKTSARTYMDCMLEAARSDQRYAAEVIKEGYDKASDEFISELKRGF